jgi:ring-1,2-phenylacetyl-CoA epoxidase subunit PaaD
VVSAATAATARAAIDEASAWQALGHVLDPEVPVLSVLELGIVRGVSVDRGAVRVMITPTYSGCPATEAIQDAVRAALLQAGASTVHVELQYAPAWTTDWIAPDAAEKLRRYGIAPPHTVARDTHTLRFHPRPAPRPACPRCESVNTERISEFGSTACKSLYRCVACREPFDYFKPI